MIPYKFSRKSPAEALVSIRNLLLIVLIVFVLSTAREIIIPMALAGLMTFILSPLVSAIERWIGRTTAVLFVVLLLVAGVGVAGWTLTQQLVDLAAKLPEYQVNIKEKLHSLRIPAGGTFERLSHSVGQLKQEIPEIPQPLPSDSAGALNPRLHSDRQTDEAVPVKIMGNSASLSTDILQSMITLAVGPLGSAGIFFLLLFFMLLHRDNLRSRFIRLVGEGHISTTTRAMDDAAARISRYLSMQFLDNTVYGILISAGLYFIGVPNAVLWGAIAGIFRFIPYVGILIGVSIPLALSVAISNSWIPPLLTLGLFILLELINANAIEPWLYGSSTGVSPMAIIVSAIFWSWLWGPVGLMLATPLTVCLAVMGRHMKQLEFLSVILSEEQPLEPYQECYHRLLAFGLNETGDLLDTFLKTNTRVALYDSVLIPVVNAAEMDFQRDTLDEDHRSSLHQCIRDIVEDLDSPNLVAPSDASSTAGASDASSPESGPARCILCLPVRAERDELAAMMFAQHMRSEGIDATVASVRDPLLDLCNFADKGPIDLVCLSVVAPSTIIHARYLCGKVRSRFPRLSIVVGIWGVTENVKIAEEKLRASGADEVATSILQAVTVCNARLASNCTDPRKT